MHYYSASNDAYIMNVYSDSSPFFVFGRSLPPTGDIPDQFTQEEREKLAESFLHEHGLLDFPNRIEPVYGRYGQNHEVAVSQLVDGVPLYQSASPWIWVLLDGEGQVSEYLLSEAAAGPRW